MTRDQLIQHILKMKTLDPSYAEKSHKWYSAMLPWLDLPSWEALGAKQ